MKKVILVCRDCGCEERIDVYSPEEAIKKNISTKPPRCPKCGSYRVELHD